MFRCASSEVVQQLAAVDLGHVSLRVDHRHDQAAVEVLAPGVAIQAKHLQTCANLGTGYALICGNIFPPIPNYTIGQSG